MSTLRVGRSGQMLLVCDLDGTLTFSRSRPDDVVMRALLRAEALPSVRLVIATARSPRCVRRWFGPLGARIDMICCNGALHIAPDGQAARRPLPAKSLAVLLERFDAREIGYCLEYGDHFVASSATALPWMGTGDRRLLDGRVPNVEGVLKCSVDEGDHAVEQACGLRGLSVVVHATGDGDVMATDVTKASTLATFRAPEESVTAFGNDLNDLDLLREADQGLVVGPGLRLLDGLDRLQRVPAEPSSVAVALEQAVRVFERIPTVWPAAKSGGGRRRDQAMGDLLSFRQRIEERSSPESSAGSSRPTCRRCTSSDCPAVGCR